MDKKKKIIVGVVAGLFSLALVFMIKFMVFNDADEEDQSLNIVSISMPEVDENELEYSTKKQKYDKEDEPENMIDPFSSEESEELKKSEEPKDSIKQNIGKLTGKDTKKNNRKKVANSQKNQMDQELMMILEMQKQIEEERKLVSEDANNTKTTTTTNIQDTPNQNSQESQIASSRLSNAFLNNNGFFGAGSFSENDFVRDLIPAETVDQGLIIQGSTIAIRTKKQLVLKDLGIIIPKNSIVYGKASFGGPERLTIDIVSYKANNQLFELDLKVFDFDGREGVHLSNRSWTKIPSKVANDIYKYAYRKGTQGSTFGGEDTSINLDEVKDAAILSAAKEVSDELFKKRRVLMPRKYNIWINVDTDSGL
ncbi:conjugative transposon protein TraM [Aquimarina sp. 2201CG14-23]|uniref:conjugative transposon protein TraM n=1 Tax=Aquimarina mycalae TaxID=3040073 RepID=UPI002477D28A|nr:conjugative transposon protein TraM [Aquimarina sp. 2201CG14-23]MDH7445851.1 conjugative transposon protein TraM [Aquimarina sp. 2201CG14-23]